MNTQTDRIEADLVVIGAGPGGYTAAFRGADLGLKTVLVERHETLGGVCLNVGCVPSKSLLHVAHVIDNAREAAAHGVTFGAPEIDREKVASWKSEVVAKLTGGLAAMAKQRGITVVRGVAEFADANTLAIAGPDGNSTVGFEKAIIATGSRASWLPFIPEDPRVMGSTEALLLEAIPKRLLVIGGGIIGLEMATVYNALGSAITVVELTKDLIPGCDKDLVRPLTKRIKGMYENVFTGTKVTGVEAKAEGLEVSFEGVGAPSTDVFDKILVAVGRTPNASSCAPEKAGVQVGPDGLIPVDRQMRTVVDHIFAIGDIVAGPMLAHKASAQGKVAAEAAAGEDSRFEERVIPSVAYTDPEVAWVGLTETEAKEKGINVGKGRFPWAASGRSLSMGRSEGLTKLLFDEESGRLLGAGFVGPGASELVAEAALAIELGADAKAIGGTVHPHPTLSESVAMAAEVYEGTVTDLYIPKKRK